MLKLSQLERFDRDKDNINKNWLKHGVHFKECEQVFNNLPLFISPDKIHSKKEARLRVLGRTNNNRDLFIVFIIRNNKIRIISARDQSRKERRIYEQFKKTTKKDS